MKKALKIIGIILLVIVVIAAALVIWQWDYVKSFLDGIMYDEETLGYQQVIATEKTVSEVNDYLSTSIRELTEEEKEKIAAGELSQSALLAQIISEATGVPLEESTDSSAVTVPDAAYEEPQIEQPADKEEPPKPEESSPKTPVKPVQPENGASASNSKPSQGGISITDKTVAETVNKLYGLQSQYTGKLQGLLGRAKTYYYQQKAASGAAAARANTITAFSGEAAAMESECDAKVEALLGDLTSKLNSMCADTSIVGTLRSAYKSEKASQRAAYVNKYMK